jgi:hypothetical protein
MSDIVTSPIRFLGATVLSFSTSIGLGSAQESSLSVDLVEDCENGDVFLPAAGNDCCQVGAPVYFSTGIDGEGFSFGGVLSSWTGSQSGSGRTFNAKVVDPRQLLQNVVVIIDSYLGPPIQGINYYNVYAAYESDVLGGDCQKFGSSGSTEKGTPYLKIIEKLQQLNPTICSPTGYQFTINWQSFPVGVPEFYRLPGPNITILQLLQDVCNVLGFEFYVYMSANAVINIGLIDLKNPPESFGNIIDQFDGSATDLTYGQELRNEVTKAVIFGEKQHYLSPVFKFNYYFGEEWDGQEFVPIIPVKFDLCYGFWINKRITELNVTLNKPIAGPDVPKPPYSISEQDIKAAMASYSTWWDRVTNAAVRGSFNEAVRKTYKLDDQGIRKVFEAVKNDPSIDNQTRYKALTDVFGGPNKGKIIADLIQQDLQNIFNFIQNLGTTYYGRQFFVPLNETICYYRGEKFQELIFSSEPTQAGGWVDPGTPVIGLSDPDLGSFRETDERISCFALFTIDDDNVPEEEKTTSPGQNENNSESQYSPGGG